MITRNTLKPARALTLAILLGVSLAGSSFAAETPSPAQQVDAIIKEYDAAQSAYTTAIRSARNDDARADAQKKRPDVERFAGRLCTVAEKHPRDPAAVDALLWVANEAQHADQVRMATKLLLDHHIESEKLDRLGDVLSYWPSDVSEKPLRQIIAKSPHRKVQGSARFTLATIVKESSASEAEKLLTEVIEKYGDVRGNSGLLSERAKSELFEVTNLAIGKVAPEIEGEDADGTKFKLSDYRGKVVVIDFWGDW